MIVFDTHAFVWWVASRSKLSARARKAIDKAHERAISDITLWEIASLVELGRLRLDRDVEAWLHQAIEDSGVEVIAIDAAVAARSTRMAQDFHGDPADRLIAATAVVHGATLITADQRLLASPAVRTVW